MISHIHQFIFIHINKTGGTSIEKVFVDDADVNIIEDKHKDIEWYAEKYPKQFKSYFKFAFVRNPWDKVVSQYIFRKNAPNSKFSSKNMTFEEFVNNPVGFKFKCQLDWIVVNKNLAVDFVGRFETIQKDFNFVFDKLNINKMILPHVFKSDRMHYSKYYNDETRKLIADIFARDIEYFGYQFNRE